MEIVAWEVGGRVSKLALTPPKKRKKEKKRKKRKRNNKKSGKLCLRIYGGDCWMVVRLRVLFFSLFIMFVYFYSINFV